MGSVFGLKHMLLCIYIYIYVYKYKRTGDGDSADLTPDLVLLKRYYLSTTEVLGIMIDQANGN